MTRVILSAALAIALVAGVSAQEKPNFAGKWKAAGSFNSWTITVEGSRMTVTMTVAADESIPGSVTRRRTVYVPAVEYVNDGVALVLSSNAPSPSRSQA